VPVAALVERPTEVRARICGSQEVDLLEVIVADIADDQVPGRIVEGESPWHPQAVGEDLGARIGSIGERVVGGDCVGKSACRLWVDSQDLSGQPFEVLARVGIVALAKADVEEAIGAELELTAQVGPAVAWDREDGPAARAQGPRG
jgi:hypothetical protein